jgi:hypothetical protein
LPSPLQVLPLLTKSRASFGRMGLKILKVPNTSTSITQRSTQFSSKTLWAIGSKFAITAWINSSYKRCFDTSRFEPHRDKSVTKGGLAGSASAVLDSFDSSAFLASDTFVVLGLRLNYLV